MLEKVLQIQDILIKHITKNGRVYLISNLLNSSHRMSKSVKYNYSKPINCGIC